MYKGIAIEAFSFVIAYELRTYIRAGAMAQQLRVLAAVAGPEFGSQHSY